MSVEQSMSALSVANRIRIDRAKIKKDIFKGEKSVAAVVLTNPPEVETMRISELLNAQYRWGWDRTRRFLRSLPMSESKPVGDLTERQRDQIARRLHGGLREVQSATDEVEDRGWAA